MKTKIYLAKSNRANPDHVLEVRKTLLEFDVEVVEFTGGGYSHKPLLGCDYLVVIPELEDGDYEDEWVDLGKGLHEQIQAFECENNKCNIFIVTDCSPSYGAKVSGFSDLDFADESDFINYSSANLDDNFLDESLKSTLENRIGYNLQPSTNTSSSSRYRLLLVNN